MTIHVLYHANCMDGLGAKYAAWKIFGDNGANYIPVNYGKPFPEKVQDGDSVYILDFSYPLETITALLGRLSALVVLDHHKTAFEALRPLRTRLNGIEAVDCETHLNLSGYVQGTYLDISLDNRKSGATLAWRHFHKEAPVPKLLQCVEDRDLWKFEFPETHAVHQGLFLLEGNMSLWDKASGSFEEFSKVVEGGKILENYRDITVQRIARRARYVDFLGLKAAVVNSTEYQSDVGDYLLHETGDETGRGPDLAIIFTVHYNNVGLSFRSSNQQSIDVSSIAKHYFGGGGHFHASGGSCDLPTLQRILAGEFFTNAAN